MRNTRSGLRNRLRSTVCPATAPGRYALGRIAIGLCLLSAIMTVLTYSSNMTRILYTATMDIQETTHVTFLKIHKVGSSTVQNIFLRFGDARNLTFVMGSVKHNECNNFSNCISFNNTLSDTNIVPPPRNRKYDIMCSHVIYNKEQFRKYLPPDTKYIGLVREPVSRLASAVAHFRLLSGVNFTQYADDPIKYEHPRLNNAMAREFGYRTELFPTDGHRVICADELREIDQYTKELLNDFTLIMVNEKLSESLVLLKRMLNWKTQDILFINKMMRKHQYFDEHDKIKLKIYLKLDYTLYDMALAELEAKIEREGREFYDEVEDFAQVNSAVTEYCKSSGHSNILIVERSSWNDEFNVTKNMCDDLLTYEVKYMEKLRVKQYGTLDTV